MLAVPGVGDGTLGIRDLLRLPKRRPVPEISLDVCAKLDDDDGEKADCQYYWCEERYHDDEENCHCDSKDGVALEGRRQPCKSLCAPKRDILGEQQG